jgi:hypothetical protein
MESEANRMAAQNETVAEATRAVRIIDPPSELQRWLAEYPIPCRKKELPIAAPAEVMRLL